MSTRKASSERLLEMTAVCTSFSIFARLRNLCCASGREAFHALVGDRSTEEATHAESL